MCWGTLYFWNVALLMDIQEDEDLHPPTCNAGRYEQAESMHHIYVQSIKQVPPPFSVTKKREEGN